MSTRSDKKAWRDTQSFGDLGRLMADWLEGRIRYWPAYCGSRPESETRHLIPVLAAANRAGFLTTCSQPGDDAMARGSRWRQKAAVQGFVHDPALHRRIVSAAQAARLIVIDGPAGGAGRRGIPVTDRDGEPVTWFGVAEPAAALREFWGEVGAYQQLAESRDVVIIDPEWGRDDRLWSALARAVR